MMRFMIPMKYLVILGVCLFVLLLIVSTRPIINFILDAIRFGKLELDPESDCSKYAQMVIKQKELSPVYECWDETENETAHRIKIIHGPPMDCPAGCLYRYYEAIITEEGGIQKVKTDIRG